jgi:hypothetical protein
MWNRRLTGRDPYADQRSALSAVRAVVDGLTLPGPLTGLAVELTGLVGTTGKQTSFFTDVRAHERALAMRSASSAPNFVYRKTEPWSRIPERREVLAQFSP